MVHGKTEAHFIALVAVPLHLLRAVTQHKHHIAHGACAPLSALLLPPPLPPPDGPTHAFVRQGAEGVEEEEGGGFQWLERHSPPSSSLLSLLLPPPPPLSPSPPSSSSSSSLPPPHGQEVPEVHIIAFCVWCSASGFRWWLASDRQDTPNRVFCHKYRVY